MSVIKTTVAKSKDVKDAALNLNVKAYEVRRTLAAVWNVQSTRAQPPSPQATFSLDMKNESFESIVGEEDDRVLVDKIHFAPGGKYRCQSIKFAFILCILLISSCSNFEAFHPLRVSKAWEMGHGYRLADQA